MDSLAQIDREVSVCTDCPLSRDRNRTVPGEGPENAEIMLIGEAPGSNEDKEGRPFVGAAGHFLEQLLALAKLSRKDVYITNTVKCRPLNNRDPLPEEKAACRKYLDRQIEAISPKVVVTLGRHSLTSFLPNEAISKVRARPRRVNGITLFPMYHPAAALYQQSLRKVIEEDIMKLPALLKEISSVQEQAPPVQPVRKATEGEQLSMI
ncbi:MAG: uracil-DNA glycosylase [Chloroflexi bacterium]|nr:uracil-DNA glycosylase [Chloroflexota bacterium]